jgi:hypothetical protein
MAEFEGIEGALGGESPEGDGAQAIDWIRTLNDTASE